MASDGLSPLDIDTPCKLAQSTARTLLKAYYAQDRRESALLQRNPQVAAQAASEAVSAMADVFATEFPDHPPPEARRAGRKFMKGLFIQDEIENYHFMSDLSATDADDLFVSDMTVEQSHPADDPRWGAVRAHLNDVCAAVGIPEEYSRYQTRFWKLHGQLEDYWEDVARQAHDLKLEGMTRSIPDETRMKLGTHFIIGVQRHDEWTHSDREADIETAQAVVSRYYQKIFELQGRV